jgi:hypothetical protein
VLTWNVLGVSRASSWSSVSRKRLVIRFRFIDRSLCMYMTLAPSGWKDFFWKHESHP